jgi:hypothetical protein
MVKKPMELVVLSQNSKNRTTLLMTTHKADLTNLVRFANKPEVEKEETFMSYVSSMLKLSAFNHHVLLLLLSSL